MATIVVVDDRALNREFLVTLLGYAGHRLLEASDGMEGLEIVRAQRPDLVIVDLVRPPVACRPRDRSDPGHFLYRRLPAN